MEKPELTLNQRNTAAFEQAVKDLQEITNRQQVQLNALENLVGALQVRLQTAEHTNLVLRARQVGNGPSE